MPYITTHEYISEERYISHELAKLASCWHVMPISVTSAVLERLVGKRHDCNEWVKAFWDKARKLKPELFKDTPQPASTQEKDR